MIPKLLILDDFLSYAHAEVDYRGQHLVALAGENGAGKSALAVDALTWALWGESRARSDDDLVRQGADDCRVEVHVEARGWEYVVIRQRHLPTGGRAGTSTLALVRQGDLRQDEEPVVLTAETIRETQERIDAALGLDYSTFINTACLIQGRADEFTRAAPGDRKKVLASLLGLEHWQAWAAAIHDEVRAVEEKTNRLDALVIQGRESLVPAPVLREELAAFGPSLARLQEASDSARAVAEEARRLAGDQQNLQAERDRVSAGLKQRQEQRDRIAAAIERIDGQIALTPEPHQVAAAHQDAEYRRKGAEGLEQMEAAEQDRRRLAADVEAFTRQLQRETEAMIRAEEALAEIPTEMAVFESRTCSLCGQALATGEARDTLKAGLEKRRRAAQEHLENVRHATERDQVDLDVAQSALARIPDRQTELVTARAHARALPAAAAKVAALEEAVKGAQGLQDARQGQVAELAVTDAALTELDAAWAALEAKWKETAGYAAHIAQTGSAEQVALHAYEDARADRDRLQGRVDQLALVEISLGDTEKEALRLTGELEAGRTLERAFGPRGVQALLIDSAIPEIVDEANRLLTLMTGGSTTIEMTTQRTGKTTGKEIETLDVVIADAMGVRPYENYSGGERFRIDFGLRIALSRLLARRANAPCRTLIVDEGFGSQDGNGRSGLVEALATVSDQFGLVLVISHVDDIRELFPATVIVRKGSNGSEVSLV